MAFHHNPHRHDREFQRHKQRHDDHLSGKRQYNSTSAFKSLLGVVVVLGILLFVILFVI